jgi:DNA-binding MarR family transcriptional regulator
MFAMQTPSDYPKPSRLNRLMHEPVRLHIVIHLVQTGEDLRFSDLRKRLSVTQGNLASHLKALQTAGVVETLHHYGEPNAEYCRLTLQGREEFLAYLEELNAVLGLLS